MYGINHKIKYRYTNCNIILLYYLSLEMMTSLNYEEDNLHLTHAKYFNKQLQLKIIKQILITKNNALQLKNRILKEKIKELNNINHNVWLIEDKFCNKIWDFSFKHNFTPFFNCYPNITKVNELHECEYTTIIDSDTGKSNTHKENALLKLKEEIKTLNNEITLIYSKNLEEDLKCCQLSLNDLKSFSEEISELIRFINDTKHRLNTSNTPVNQKPNSCVIEGFKNARKLFVNKSNFHNYILTEKKCTPRPTKIIQGSKECYDVKTNVKFGRFTMKKRSIISLKFEKNINSK
ncbi:uncharacterized protein LOC143433308 [Xylocopa sonorina]|uniref:uncharacterized protein LOC143433308 n=1 Tax=Xylocopa sonorina TaxID=1818115 RepID=UPI00403AFF11